MVLPEIINNLTSSKKGRLIILFSSVGLVALIIMGIYFMTGNNKDLNDYTVVNSSSLVDKDNKLLNTLGINWFAYFRNRLCDFLEAQNLPRNSDISVSSVESQTKDLHHVDVKVNIPSLDKENLLVQLRFDYDLEQEMFIVPDYSYSIVLYK